jgi:hypothetical protein
MFRLKSKTIKMKNKSTRAVSNGDAESNAKPENNIMMSTRERRKMEERIWNRVGKVSAPLFMEILVNAANAMLDDLQKPTVYPNVYVSRSTLFRPNGELTPTGECYVRLEFKKLIPGEFRGGRRCSYEFIGSLAGVLDNKLFGFFENERRLKQKSSSSTSYCRQAEVANVETPTRLKGSGPPFPKSGSF